MLLRPPLTVFNIDQHAARCDVLDGSVYPTLQLSCVARCNDVQGSQSISERQPEVRIIVLCNFVPPLYNVALAVQYSAISLQRRMCCFSVHTLVLFTSYSCAYIALVCNMAGQDSELSPPTQAVRTMLFYTVHRHWHCHTAPPRKILCRTEPCKFTESTS